jgi:ferric-dicitrate binding protein FerR (iron transport regulator)
MTPKELSRLFKKYRDGTLGDAEKRKLDEWYLQEAANSPARLTDPEMAELSDRLRMGLPLDYPARQRSLWPRIAAAASILLILSAGGYFLLKPKSVQQTAQVANNDIAPGHNQATLTLANGKKIILTKGLSGLLAIQGKTTIQATANDIAYNNTQNEDQVSYNTLSTARGEQSPYPLVLADGTKVWLNAESSITFPTAFNQKERVVKLTGEAYFEVRHDARQPFKIITAKQTIEDVGTEFDVQAYPDEPKTVTTLLEGAVRVNGKVLNPGQQSDGTTVSAADTETAIAWKNGLIRFDNNDVKTLMRQLARWYNVSVVYQGAVTGHTFAGEIRRNTNLSNVLKILDAGGVHCRIDDRTLIVKPD